jgi:hypothetical protein
MGLENIRIADIVIDNEVQQRERMNEEVVWEYAEILDVLPPISVFQEGERYWLADGFHRLRAHVVQMREEIMANVTVGAKRDATLFAVSANTMHGLRPTPADKRRAVTTLLRDPEWRQWSNREVARKAVVSDKLVGRIRQELSEEIPIPDVTRGSDGRMSKAVRPVAQGPKPFRPDRFSLASAMTAEEHARYLEIMAGIDKDLAALGFEYGHLAWKLRRVKGEAWWKEYVAEMTPGLRDALDLAMRLTELVEREVA